MRKLVFTFWAAFITLFAVGQGGTFVYYAYVANSNSNTVSVVNTNTNAIVTTIAVGSSPTAVSVSPNGSRAYVANGNATVSVINTVNNQVISTIPVPPNPQGIAVSTDGSKVYVGSRNNGTVTVINAATNTVSTAINVGSSPMQVLASPDGTKIFVSNEGDGQIRIINTSDNSVVTTPYLGNSTESMVLSPDGSTLYVACMYSSWVAAYNVGTGGIAHIDTGADPFGLALSPDGSKLYVSEFGSTDVKVFNRVTQALIASITTSASSFNNFGLGVSHDGSKLFVGSYGSNQLTVVNTATNTVAGSITVGYGPKAVGKFVSSVPALVASGNISYPGSPFCQTGVGFVTLGAGTPAGGTYSAPAGLHINSTTGVIYPASSTPGTYTVTYIFTGGLATTSVTVLPTPKISVGTVASVCQSDVLFKVPFSVTNSPVSYSISADPSAPMPGFTPVVDATLPVTNTIDVAIPTGSAGGTYKFDISVKNAQGCVSPGKVVATLTVATPATTSISYPSPMCQTGQILPTRTGAAGGTYSSTTGLYLNSTSGLITPALSTPGTYTVTYTVTTTSCLYSTTTVVTIIATPKITLPSLTALCVGTGGSTASIPYNVTAGAPATYDLMTAATNPVANFVPVIGAAITPNNINVSVPAGTPAGFYDFDLYVISAEGCRSSKYVFRVKVLGPCPVTSPVFTRTSIRNKKDTDGQLDNNIIIAPNPVRRMLNIHTAMQGKMIVHIANAEGRMLLPNANFNSSYSFDMSGYAPGIYIVEVVNEKTGEIVRKKVVKE